MVVYEHFIWWVYLDNGYSGYYKHSKLKSPWNRICFLVLKLFIRPLQMFVYCEPRDTLDVADNRDHAEMVSEAFEPEAAAKIAKTIRSDVCWSAKDGRFYPDRRQCSELQIHWFGEHLNSEPPFKEAADVSRAFHSRSSNSASCFLTHRKWAE